MKIKKSHDFKKSSLAIAYVTKDRSLELINSIISVIRNIDINVEIHILDNGSNEHNVSLLTNFLDENNINYYYYSNDNYSGVSRSRNLLYSLISSEFIFFLDDDAYLITKVNYYDDIQSKFDEIKNLIGLSCISIDARFPNSTIPFLYSKVKNNNNIKFIRGYVGFNHIIKKDIHIDFLYPDNLIYGSEELYFSLNAYRKHLKIGINHSLVVLHKPSSSFRLDTIERKINGVVNTFVIKSYFIPNLFLPLSFLMFFLRLLKNFLFKPKYILKSLKLVLDRREKKYIRRYNIRTYLFLLYEYGLKDNI
jgi:hypothetical protein